MSLGMSTPGSPQGQGSKLYNSSIVYIQNWLLGKRAYLTFSVQKDQGYMCEALNER